MLRGLRALGLGSKVAEELWLDTRGCRLSMLFCRRVYGV